MESAECSWHRHTVGMTRQGEMVERGYVAARCGGHEGCGQRTQWLFAIARTVMKAAAGASTPHQRNHHRHENETWEC